LQVKTNCHIPRTTLSSESPVADGLNPPRGVCEVDVLPVVPAENPQAGLRTLRCSQEIRSRDAKAAGRIGLADADVSARSSGSLRFRAGRNYNFACFVEGEEEERVEQSSLPTTAGTQLVLCRSIERHGQWGTRTNSTLFWTWEVPVRNPVGSHPSSPCPKHGAPPLL